MNSHVPGNIDALRKSHIITDTGIMTDDATNINLTGLTDSYVGGDYGVCAYDCSASNYHVRTYEHAWV
jgi:hypothetical protein